MQPNAQHPRPWKSTAVVTGLALVVFAPTAVLFASRTTDLSAIRVLGGELLYRDIWTMYAPGSIYVTALAYACFGVQMIVGNLLGVLVSAASVGALHRLTLRVAEPRVAAVVALVFAAAFLGSGYQSGLSSYPPAILFVLLAFDRIAGQAGTGSRRDALVAGLFLGVAALLKHDVAAYGCLAAAAGVLAVPVRGLADALRTIGSVALPVVTILGTAIALLVAGGAGPAMIEDFLVFPSTYFRHVRPEGFPFLPPIFDGLDRLEWWFFLNAPLWALVAGIPGVARGWREAAPEARRAAAVVAAVYPLFWMAGHVQANTHKVSMAGIACVFCAAGLLRFGARRWSDLPPVRHAVHALVVLWIVAVVGPGWFGTLRSVGPHWESVGLPRLAGIYMPPFKAAWMRELAEALEQAGPPGAPLLQVGRRNDVLIFAGSEPYWLSDRPMVTPYHELHPGITDVEPGQRRMLEDLSRVPLPVLVREHRFGDEPLDHWGDIYRAGGVPVGAMLLDDWVAENYEPWKKIRAYEVMRTRR